MATVAEALAELGQAEEDLEVVLSSEIVGLLSQQLYQSPIKAIEELVVNAYDADATVCRVALPDVNQRPETQTMVVFDDGTGMDHAGLESLWHVGQSTKQQDRVSAALNRRQIGKFGIGKLATYVLAYKVSYITRSAGQPSDDVRMTTLDYESFMSSPSGRGIPVRLPVRRLNVGDLKGQRSLMEALTLAGVDVGSLDAHGASWTIVMLERLRPSARALQRGRLRWVLATAMPLGDSFFCYVDGERIQSSKENLDLVASFSVIELTDSRLKSLKEATGEDWTVVMDSLVSPTFPNGVSGEIIVTRQAIYGTKSDDLIRSNGFFVKVRGRLINMDEPLFGMRPLSYETFSRFRATVVADDLDDVITAPREGVERGEKQHIFAMLLEQLYYEARSRFEAWKKTQDDKEKRKPEPKRNHVNPRYVEHPTADALFQAASENSTSEGEPAEADADGSWFYLNVPENFDLAAVGEKLYEIDRATVYKYETAKRGRTARMVSFDPVNAVFTSNADHELVRAYTDNAAGAQNLLDDVLTAEALLEIYLREKGIPSHIVGEVLEQRDQLFRSLTRDEVYSNASIAQDLRDAASDERDLEMNLVIAARALGFVAKHLSGATNPDGVARLHAYPGHEWKITLEAKSSQDVPSLSAIDFGGLDEHVKNENAHGCLLVAPAYPGSSKEDDAAAARRAINLHISCWTVEQLAKVIDASDRRQLTARHVLDIVRTAFSPAQVSEAVRKLLEEPAYDGQLLYKEIIAALRSLDGRLKDAPRTKSQISGIVSLSPGFEGVTGKAIETAIDDVAGASRGALRLDGTSGATLILSTSIDELERRIAGLLGEPGPARRASTFKDRSAGNGPAE